MSESLPASGKRKERGETTIKTNEIPKVFPVARTEAQHLSPYPSPGYTARTTHWHTQEFI